MSASGHISFRGWTVYDVDNGVEEVGFAVLAAEGLVNVNGLIRVKVRRNEERTYPTYYVLMVGQMCLACLAAKDLVAIEICVI